MAYRKKGLRLGPVVFIIFLFALFFLILYLIAPKPDIDTPSDILITERPIETSPVDLVLEPPVIQEEPAAESENGVLENVTLESGALESELPVSQTEEPVQVPGRNIYFIQAGNDSYEMQLINVSRNLTSSNAPLMDSINVMLQGPTTDEENRGIMSFIPVNSRLLSARVENETAYLNFNEAFRYNTGGREGYEAQIRQIVYTATEFSTVKRVQFLIEGNIVDELSQDGGIIRYPIGRN